jgi:hypothetical protein
MSGAPEPLTSSYAIALCELREYTRKAMSAAWPFSFIPVYPLDFIESWPWVYTVYIHWALIYYY